MSSGKVGQVGGGIDLDVHALSELKSQSVPQTDDSPKYGYVVKDDNSGYGMRLKSWGFPRDAARGPLLKFLSDLASPSV